MQKGDIIMKRYQFFFVAFTALSLFALSRPSAYAAIPVIDDQNIAQQAKTYAETVKVVTKAQEQIQKQIQELTSWPNEQLNRLETTFNKGVDRLEKNLTKGSSDIIGRMTKMSQNGNKGGFDEAQGMQIAGQMLAQAFPSLGSMSTGDSVSATDAALMASKAAGWSFMKGVNQETIAKYADYMSQITDASDELQHLVAMSSKAVGAKQSAQIANQIGAVKGRIEAINTVMQVLKGQQQILKTQQETQEKINQKAVVDQKIKAEAETMKKLTDKSTSPIPNTDPWAKYSTWH